MNMDWPSSQSDQSFPGIQDHIFVWAIILMVTRPVSLMS